MDAVPTPSPYADPVTGRVTLEVLRRGPITRADLARNLGLSSGSLTRLTKPLVAGGILIEHTPAGPSTDQGGRPGTPLSVAPDAAHFVGINLGEGRLLSVLVDLGGRVLERRFTGGDWSDPVRVVEAIAGQVDAHGARGPVAGIGISLGANVAAGGIVSHVGGLRWPETPLAELVGRATGLVVSVANDVNAYALAEHWFGVGRGCSEFAVVTIGAGVGAGLIVHDELAEGHGGAAGMVGYLRTGDGGSFGDFLMSGSIAWRASQVLGRPVRYPEVTALAATDPTIGRIADDVARRAGELAASVGLVTAPQRILVSGDGVHLLAGREHLVAEGASAYRDAGDDWQLIVRPAGFDEWARGAAVLALRRHVTGWR